MEILKNLGFTSLDNQMFNEININPLFTPILIRYHGLGWYQVIIQKCRTNKYRVIPMGGSSYLDHEANLEEYRKLSNQGDSYTLEDLALKIQANPSVFVC